VALFQGNVGKGYYHIIPSGINIFVNKFNVFQGITADTAMSAKVRLVCAHMRMVYKKKVFQKSKSQKMIAAFKITKRMASTYHQSQITHNLTHHQNGWFQI
jgi:hypothetical protein